MSKKLDCWYELDKLRAREEEIIKELAALRQRKKELRNDCLALLGNYPSELLTLRETEVLTMLQENPGFTDKELADRLNITTRTVKFHISGLIRKYGVRRRFELPSVVKGL